MKISHRIASVAAAGLLGAALSVAAPGAANAAEPCIFGTSNTGERSCVTNHLSMAPVLTLGNGLCPGMLRPSGTAFDGPLEYSSPPGAVHSVELMIEQGYSPIGEWGSAIGACDATAVIDWNNVDSGRSGSVTQHIPANRTSATPAWVTVDTGPGRVRFTIRTVEPSIPVSAEVVVP